MEVNNYSHPIVTTSPKAVKLFMEGTEALATVEKNGIRIDVDYCHKISKKLQKQIDVLEAEIKKTVIWKHWVRVYKDKANIDSGDQLGKILFETMKISGVKTDKGKWKVDEEALSEHIGTYPVLHKYIRAKKLKKSVNTYFAGFLRAEHEGIVRPFFNLHTVQTFRSSSSDPNLQNIPIRDPMIGELVRKVFIPRDGNQLCEVDFSGIEVRIAACLHKDPTMLKYIHDKTTDMHRDMAIDCYKLDPEEFRLIKDKTGKKWLKDCRYCAKNKFVFPQFYGDWYEACARNLWKAIRELDLHTGRGIPMQEHLAGKGIHNLADFTKHIQAVEKHFWYNRFPVYTEWKEKHWKKYLTRGYFDLPTGFRCIGHMERNAAINYPVQGSAFHCLLKTLIETTKWLKKKRMRTKIICQIHDSLLLDMVPEERKEILVFLHDFMTRRLQKLWPWIIVPLDVEAEIAPIGASWFEKQEVEMVEKEKE